jgi:hypothetical protein
MITQITSWRIAPLLMIIFFISCSGEKKHIPSDIILQDEMADILTDVHLAEASTDNRGTTMPQINRMMATKYDSLFRRHHVTFEQFKSSYNFYLDHPDYLSDIYTEVVNKLTTLESRVTKRKKVVTSPIMKKDSLQQVLNNRETK